MTAIRPRDALGFSPERIPVAEFPHAPGTGVYVRDDPSWLWTVVDHDGFAFVACCARHERDGKASGFHPSRDRGRILQGWAAGAVPPDDCDHDPAGFMLGGSGLADDCDPGAR